jgi:hypothetical protein
MTVHLITFASFVDTIESDEHFKQICERREATDEMIVEAKHFAYEIFMLKQSVFDVIRYAEALERMAAVKTTLVTRSSTLMKRFPGTQMSSLVTRAACESISLADKHLESARILQLAVDLRELHHYVESAKTSAG